MAEARTNRVSRLLRDFSPPPSRLLGLLPPSFSRSLDDRRQRPPACYSRSRRARFFKPPSALFFALCPLLGFSQSLSLSPLPFPPSSVLPSPPHPTSFFLFSFSSSSRSYLAFFFLLFPPSFFMYFSSISVLFFSTSIPRPPSPARCFFI